MSTTDTQLWQQLQEAGLVQGAEPPAREDRGYWYIRLMQGVGGWIGALFLLGFVGITLPLGEQTATHLQQQLGATQFMAE